MSLSIFSILVFYHRIVSCQYRELPHKKSIINSNLEEKEHSLAPIKKQKRGDCHRLSEPLAYARKRVQKDRRNKKFI